MNTTKIDTAAASSGVSDGHRQLARDLADYFRIFTKSSHLFRDGRPLHIVTAELLEAVAACASAAPVPATSVQQPVQFPNRRAVEREIASAENPPPGALNFNDGKERVTLPGGTLRYMLALIDRAAAPIQQAAPAPVVPAREEWFRERAQLRKQITDLERIKHDLEGRLFDALKTDKWLAEGLEEVDHAPNISRGVYSKVLDVACVAVARVKELEAPSRIDADKLHREIVGWVRDEDGTTREPAFLRGPARPPRDYRGNYRPVIYETGARHAAAELVSDALGGGDADGGTSNA